MVLVWDRKEREMDEKLVIIQWETSSVKIAKSALVKFALVEELAIL